MLNDLDNACERMHGTVMNKFNAQVYVTKWTLRTSQRAGCIA